LSGGQLASLKNVLKAGMDALPGGSGKREQLPARIAAIEAEQARRTDRRTAHDHHPGILVIDISAFTKITRGQRTRNDPRSKAE
jgi:hypothetical protein